MRKKAVLIGAGGHSKVVIDILEQQGSVEIAGCTCPQEGHSEVLGYPIIGDDDSLERLHALGIRAAIVAIGDNATRLRLLARAADAGLEIINAVSPRAHVSARAVLGRGIAIMPGAVVNAAARVGDGAIINTCATVDHDCHVGDGVHLAPGVHLAGKVAVGTGSLLGIGSCVAPGLSIGCWTVVGAGASVIKDLPDRVTAVGVPAQVIKCHQEE
jgi:UDP-perosamine 4-acetyltransferase